MDHAETLESFLGVINILESSLPRKRKHQEGYSLERLESVPSEDFLCSLCKKLVRVPVECCACGTLYCTGCIINARSSLQFEIWCQVCKSYQKKRSVSRVVNEMINELKVECKHTGCSQFLELKELLVHQKTCGFRKIRCSNHHFCKAEGFLSEFHYVTGSGLFRNLKNYYVCSERCLKEVNFSRCCRTSKTNEALEMYYKVLMQDQSNLSFPHHE